MSLILPPSGNRQCCYYLCVVALVILWLLFERTGVEEAAAVETVSFDARLLRVDNVGDQRRYEFEARITSSCDATYFAISFGGKWLRNVDVRIENDAYGVLRAREEVHVTIGNLCGSEVSLLNVRDPPRFDCVARVVCANGRKVSTTMTVFGSTKALMSYVIPSRLRRTKDSGEQSAAQHLVAYVIGAPGVGKGSTLNALMTAALDDSEAPTRIANTSPGGVQADSDTTHFVPYTLAVPNAHVTLTMFDSFGLNAKSYDQEMLRSLLRDFRFPSDVDVCSAEYRVRNRSEPHGEPWTASTRCPHIYRDIVDWERFVSEHTRHLPKPDVVLFVVSVTSLNAKFEHELQPLRDALELVIRGPVANRTRYVVAVTHIDDEIVLDSAPAKRGLVSLLQQLEVGGFQAASWTSDATTPPTIVHDAQTVYRNLVLQPTTAQTETLESISRAVRGIVDLAASKLRCDKKNVVPLLNYDSTAVSEIIGLHQRVFLVDASVTLLLRELLEQAAKSAAAPQTHRNEALQHCNAIVTRVAVMSAAVSSSAIAYGIAVVVGACGALVALRLLRQFTRATVPSAAAAVPAATAPPVAVAPSLAHNACTADEGMFGIPQH